MSSVNVTELRRDLPAYLNRVRKGQRIRVTVRGKVIAEISPPAVTSDEAAAARTLLRGSVSHYESPLEPAVAAEDWDVNR
jgi:antitoxin (DNA-binding transcriptional repressor) of toxin-antitoxin stability system